MRYERLVNPVSVPDGPVADVLVVFAEVDGAPAVFAVAAEDGARPGDDLPGALKSLDQADG